MPRLSAMISQHLLRLAFWESSFADAACSALFGALVAVKAIFARMARITSCARRACMNLRPMSWCAGCCCLQDARKHACEYYGSDGCDSFHCFRIAHREFFKRGNIKNRTTKCLPERERENFNQALFALAFFSRRQDRELPGAISRGLLDCPCRV